MITCRGGGPSKVKLTNGTNDVSVITTNGEFGLVTMSPSHVSTDNSTTDLLGIGEVFTGNTEDVTNYAQISVHVYSDVASATDGLCVQQSSDGTNWDIEDCYTIAAATGKTFTLQRIAQYFRIKYTNGAVGQSAFRLQVILSPVITKPSSHRIADPISDQDDAELVKSVLTAENPSNVFINVGASASGNLKITDAENTLAIAKGEVTGSSDVNKWGNAPDFDTADGEVDVWDGAEDGTAWELMNYVFPTTATIDRVSSTDAADTIDITLIGLDSNYDEVTQTITLNGTTPVALDTNLIRFYRGYNGNGTEFAGHIIVHEADSVYTTPGVPDTNSKIKGVIHPEEQQTEMAIYTIPAGYTGYVLGGYCSTSGSNKSSNYVIKFKIRNFGKVFRTQQKVAISDNGTSYIQFHYPVPQVVTEKTDIKVTAEMTAVGGTGASISAGFSIILVAN